MISFDFPYAFLLAPVPLLIYRYIPGYFTKERAIKVPFFTLLTTVLNIEVSHGAKELKPTPVQRISIWLGWGLLLIAAAKPMWNMEPQTFERSGRDLMLVLDLSGSMGVEDYVDESLLPQSRLAAAKAVLNDFSEQRTGDRLGLILFGDAPFVQSPFTTDYIAWSELLNQAKVGMAGESTHLGDAIGLGIKTLVGQKNEGIERVMIVLTDGNDTDSLVPPIDAAKVAAAYGVRIHMIAMGSMSTLGEEAINSGVIEEVATLTGGQYFYASSTEELSSIYKVIDEMEETMYESYTYQQSHSLHYLPVLLMVVFHLLYMSAKTLQFPRSHRANRTQ
jgi:Ca-activated chloride channel family protein